VIVKVSLVNPQKMGMPEEAVLCNSLETLLLLWRWMAQGTEMGREPAILPAVLPAVLPSP
jgi:hypothetical protein